MSLKYFFQTTNSDKENLLVFGPTSSLNDLVVNEYLMQQQFSDFEKVTIDLEIEPLGALLNTLTESSLFATQKIILIKNPVFLTGKLTSLKKHELSELESIFASINSVDHVIVIKADVQKLDARRKISKMINQSFQTVNTDFKPFVLPQIVTSLVETSGFTIEKSALNELLQRSNQQIGDVIPNLSKLYSATSSTVITSSLVRENIEQSIEQSIFEVLTHAMKHEFAEMNILFDDQIRQGTDVVGLTAILSSQISFLVQVKLLGRVMGETQISDNLKVHPYRVKLALNNKYPLKKLVVKQKRIIEIEFGYKSGKYQGSAVLKSFVLNF